MNKRFLRDIFCPLTKQNCRTDCRWCYIDIEIGNDGADEVVNCAINLIAEKCSEDEWEDYA